MQVRDGLRLYSASDLVGYLECRHLTTLALTNLETPLERAVDDESAKLIQEMGYAHEGRYLEALRSAGLRIYEVADDGSPAELARATGAAMRDGYDIIFQAAFLSGALYGKADFLRRVGPASMALGSRKRKKA
jgi:uncharacterized protein